MKKRLWHTLLCAGVALAAALTGLTVAASAEPRVLTVKLVSGEIVTVTGDVPPGTPLSAIQLPAGLGPVEWVTQQEAPPVTTTPPPTETPPPPSVPTPAP